MKLHSFREGMGTLVRVLGERVTDVTSLNTFVGRIERLADGQYELRRGDESLMVADHVVLCTPLDRAMPMVGRAAPRLITYAGVTSTTLVFKASDVPVPLDGFGTLPCHGEDIRLRGCIYASSVFPSHAVEGTVHLRVISGGVADTEFMEFNDSNSVAWVMADLKKMLGVTGTPLAMHVARWPFAIPQLEVGAVEEIEQIAALEREQPGLHLGAGWRNGPGVNDCIELGYQLASRITGRDAS
jgi:oxygen-dependent protoporphyrinogen oxidase